MPGPDIDVVVIGGGPVGMMAAGDLARRGRAVTVLERRPQISPSSRAFATMARTLEVLDSRGLADDLLKFGTTTRTVSLFGRARLDLSHLPSRYPFVLVSPQTNIDQALGRYAQAQGARLRRGVEVVGLRPDADGVTVTARLENHSDEETLRARYVIAADGAHSTVRRLLDLDFPGRAVLSSVVLADVKLAHGPTDGGLELSSTPDGFAFLAPYGRHDADGSWFRSMTWDRTHQVADSEPVGEGEAEQVLNRSMGRDLGVVEIGAHSRFHSEERQVTNYRVGRVFLAGDAAHVHSPMGGQGLNTGVQDAANLAWKIDAVLAGAPEKVLDTYQSERHPIGRRVLFQSGLMLRGVTLHRRAARFLRDLVVPVLLSMPFGRDRVAGSFAGTGLRYARNRGDHRLVGTRATEIPLVGERLTRVQRNGQWVLILRAEDEAPESVPNVTPVRRSDDGPAVLVRPDGYVAWSGTSPDGWLEAYASWTRVPH